MRTKIPAQLTVFLIFTAIVCVCAGFSSCQSMEAFAGTADLRTSDTMSSFAAYQPPQVLTESYDNSQILRLYSSETRELAGRRSGSHTVALRGQEAFATRHSLSPVRRYVPVAAPGNGRLSVLALSLGSNSPPVYHA